MAETRRKFDRDFKEGAVRLVREAGRPIAQVARDLGIHDGTLANWVSADRRRRDEGDGALSEDERAELARLRKEKTNTNEPYDRPPRPVITLQVKGHDKVLGTPTGQRGHRPITRSSSVDRPASTWSPPSMVLQFASRRRAGVG
jgi:transposase